MSAKALLDSVQKGSITARMIHTLFEKNHSIASLSTTLCMTPGQLRGCLGRAVRQDLIRNDTSISLTVQGRWCAVSLILDLTMAELAAAAIVYVQLKRWDQYQALRCCTTDRFATRDFRSFIKRGYKRSTAKRVYSRLIKAGIIYHASNGGIVRMTPDMITTLEKYDAELRSLQSYVTGQSFTDTTQNSFLRTGQYISRCS